MNKKAKIALAIIKKFTLSFLKLENSLTKHTDREKYAAEKTLLLTSYYLVLIITIKFIFCFDVMLLYDLLSNALCSFIYLIGSRYFEQREGKKKYRRKKERAVRIAR